MMSDLTEEKCDNIKASLEHLRYKPYTFLHIKSDNENRFKITEAVALQNLSHAVFCSHMIQ
jgi:hypothetical protein